MARKRIASIKISNSKADAEKREPYATIAGDGAWGYEIWVKENPANGLYGRRWVYYRMTRAGAERAAKSKLAKMKRVIEREKYYQRITID